MNKTNPSFVTDWPLLGVMGHARAWEKETDGYFIFLIPPFVYNRIFFTSLYSPFSTLGKMNLVLTEERLGLSTRPRYYITRQAGCISISKAIRNTKLYPSPPFGLRRFPMVICRRMAIESMKVKYIKNNLCVYSTRKKNGMGDTQLLYQLPGTWVSYAMWVREREIIEYLSPARSRRVSHKK